MKGHDLRISLIGANGEQIWGAWANDFQNANSQIPLRAVVHIRCDLGHLHQLGELQLPLWSSHD